MEIVGLVRVLTNVCALRRQKQLGRAPMIVNVVVIVEVEFVARQKGIQKVVLRVTVRRTGIVKPVVQIIILIIINANPVLPVKRHHRAVHLLHRAPAPLEPVGKHTSPTIPTVAVIQALDIRV